MADDLPDGFDRRLDRDDPRLTPEFWRSLPPGEDRRAAVLVGVVHDHPASRYRVGALARALDPDVLALELPAVAVPFYERRARALAEDPAGVAEASPGETAEAATDGGRPAEGGEMTAAVAARPGAEAVGVDTVGPRFLARLAVNAVGERASPTTLRRTLSEVSAIARDALAHRLGRGDPGGGPAHGVTAGDPAADQAADERTHVARSRSLLGAVERPHADLLLDGTREGNMAARIDALRTDRTVLAVVGMDHLEAVATDLEARAAG